MTTFRKLPIIKAKANATATKIAGASVNISTTQFLRPDTPANENGVRSFLRTPFQCKRVAGSLDHRTHLEDRQVHGDNEATNQDAKNGHDQRLEQTREVVYGIVYVFFVEVCDLG